MRRPRWILDLHPEFPASEVVRARLPDPIIVDPLEALMGRWPALDGPVVGYGTMRTMTRLARVSRGVFDDYRRLQCSSYYRWLYDLLGRACVLAPFSALPSLPLARMFGPRVFVRSDTNYKLFPARVLELDEVPKWLAAYNEHRDELVVVAEPVEFVREYRCFFRGARFACGSSYPAEPYEPVPPEARAFAEEAARRLADQGLTMVTVDVGAGPDGRLRLVEIGGVNSWGIYGSDPDDFIAMMEAEAREAL